MLITFLQSGGFTGAIRGVRLDPASLPADERTELERLVATCGLEGDCERFSGAGRDRRQYDLAIERDGRTHRLSCSDDCVPEAARPRVDVCRFRDQQRSRDRGALGVVQGCCR